MMELFRKLFCKESISEAIRKEIRRDNLTTIHSHPNYVRRAGVLNQTQLENLRAHRIQPE